MKGSMRCTMCGIDYPTHIDRCPVCDEETWYNKNSEPDEMWSWRAEQARQSREIGESGVWRQPYYLNMPTVEVIHDAPGAETDEQGVTRAELLATPCLPLTEVYAYEGRKLLLKADDVVELPNLLYKQDTSAPATRLYEVMGSFRGANGSMYMLREMKVPDTFPAEWVEEFYRGD